MIRPSPRLVNAFVLALVLAGSGMLLRAQLLQPVGEWAPMGVVADARSSAASVTLADGRTLTAGGRLADGTATDTVVVYDPMTGGVVSVGQLLEARVDAAATLLPDGRVLITGGNIDATLSADVELFDLASGTSTLLGPMAQPRVGHASTRLFDGTVLIVGGTTINGAALATAEIFDPATGSTTPAGSMTTPRVGASATTLIDGRVLVAGGSDGSVELATAEIYDPLAASTFALVNTHMSVARAGHTAILLPNNAGVLLAGGTSANVAVATSDLFLPAIFPDPFSIGFGQFAPTGHMAVPRTHAVGGPAGTDGYAFVSGGGSGDAEAYRFATIKTDKDDYAPGEFAVITGSGWQPGETVTLLFQEDPAVHTDYELTVTADGSGNIYWDQWAPEQHDLNVRFYLTASDSESRAQMTFTDHAPTPTNLVATAISTTQIDLSWSGPSPAGGANANHHYHIERCTGVGCGSFIEIAQTSTANLTPNTYSDTTAIPNTTYRYRVRYHHHLPLPAVFGSYSNLADTTTPSANTVPTLNLPADFTVEGNALGGATVSYTATANDTEDGPLTPTCIPASGSFFTLGGPHTVSCSVTDSGGLTANGGFNITVVDTTPPAIDAHADMTTEATSATGAIVTYTSPATHDVVDGDGIASCLPASGSQFSLNDTTVTCNATDASSNTAVATTFTVHVVDTTPPAIDAHADVTIEATGATGAIVTYTSPATHDVVDGDGIATCLPASGSQFALGTTTVTCNATDTAGNPAVASTFSVHVIDTTPPETSIDSGPASPTNSTSATFTFSGIDLVTAAANLTFECELDGSGFSSCGSPKTYTGPLSEGSHTFKVRALDAAGNTDPTPAEFTWTIDLTPPAVTVTLASPPNGSNDWYVTVPVMINVAAIDSSNVASFSCTVNASPVVVGSLSGIGTGNASGGFTVSAEGVNAVVCEATDGVGNSGAATGSSNTATVKIDTVAPTVVHNALDSCSLPGNAGWCRGTQTTGFTASDATSGVASPCVGSSCNFTQSTGTNGATVTIASGVVTDVAGNTNAGVNAGPYKIDSVAPSITLISPANGSSYVLHSTVASDYSCNDLTSGVFSCANPVPTGANFSTSPIGAHTFTVNATDNAGNPASATNNYSVIFAPAGQMCLGAPGHAILQPIDVAGTSVFKRGSTVPAKFRVCDANGVSIGPALVVTSFVLDHTVNGVFSYPNEAVDSTTPDTAFRWSASDEQWIFNISTKTLPMGVTYVYRVHLIDGTDIFFQFGLK